MPHKHSSPTIVLQKRAKKVYKGIITNFERVRTVVVVVWAVLK